MVNSGILITSILPSFFNLPHKMILNFYVYNKLMIKNSYLQY
jgi:hypothetical protein